MATAIHVPRCPRCRTPHDGHQGSGGALECAVCDHHWFPLPTGGPGAGSPASVGISAGQAQAPAGQGSGSRPLPRPPTEEYLPGDPQTEATRHGPLTERKDGRRSGRQMVVRPAPEWAPQVPATADPTSSDLFEKLELEARVQRSNLRTLPEIPPFAVVPDGEVRSAGGDPTLVACPVCGVRFPRQPGNKRHNCPQCTTSFDEETGRLESGIGTGDRLIGATIHGCLIDRKLGEGGMGTVYHARQLSLDRSVAVKILPPDLARNKNFIQRFEREAKSLARINHPNILHIYDFGEDTQIGLYFMLIEFVEGLDLGEIINRRGQVSQVEMLDLLRQALTGLEAAAEKGVIHRDIKPDNLMIANNGTVKVSDFGLAKGMIAQVGVTAAGVRVGTPAFMSPEQCDGVDVDYRSDVYNLGATVYLCLTGRLPFDGETPFSIMLKHKTETPSPMQQLDPTIDPEVDALILRMLAKQPEARCQSLAELIGIVERLEVKLSGTDSILRKSRGPFRAMQPRVPIQVGGEGGAVVADPVGDRPGLPGLGDGLVTLPVLEPAPPAQAREPALPPAKEPALPPAKESAKPGTGKQPPAAAADQDDGWKKLVADLMPLPSAPPATGLPPAGPGPAMAPEPPPPETRTDSSSRNRAVASQPSPSHGLPTSADISRNRVSSRLTPAIRGTGEPPRLNKKVEQELAQARERGRLAEAEQMITAGDRLAGDGALPEAIRQWQVASDILAAGSIRRAEVQDRILHARQAIVRQQNRRRILYGSGITAGVILGLFLGTPSLHNWLATQRLHLLRDGLTSIPVARQRAAALEEFAFNEGEPWRWYTGVFGLTYRVAASEEARLLAEQEKPAVAPAPVVPELVVPAPVIPADSTWEEIRHLAEGARQVGRLTPLLEQQAQQATTELAQQQTDLLAIERTRATGNHAAVLDQAVAYRARHPRAAPGTLARLPIGLRVRIQVAGFPGPASFKLLVDGAPALLPTVSADANGLTVVEAVVSRMGGRETTLVVQADGWTFDQTTVPPESGAEEIALVLRPVPAWRVADARPGWVSLQALGTAVVVLRSEGLISLRAGDGVETGRFNGGGRALTPLLRGMPGGRFLVGTDDGMVQVLSSALVPEQTLHRGRNPVVALSDLELTFQNARRVRLVVEDAPGRRTLAAWDGIREWWTSAALQPGPVPFLMHVDDRVLAIDGQQALFLDEDGKDPRQVSLPANRVGTVLPLAGRREVVITTSAGHQRLYLGSRTDPLRTVEDPVLAGFGPGVAAADSDILLHGQDGSLALLQPGQPTRVLWRVANARRPTVAPILTKTLAISGDELGLVTARRRADGVVVWILQAGVPVQVPPVVVDLGGRNGVVLLDRQGNLTAYPLP